MPRRASLDEIRGFYAAMIRTAANNDAPRFERAFALVPREAFLPPGPWEIMVNGRYVTTPSDDPVYVYQNVLVALDAGRMINNGEPFLHGAWITAAAPQRGERVCHVGAGTGYYAAILSMLVLPDGAVTAIEREPDLVAKAGEALQPFEHVRVVEADGLAAVHPGVDVIYVNASLAAPPRSWLDALAPGGRLVFPWQPSPDLGLAMLVTRGPRGFAAKPLMPAWFIPCVGAANARPHAATPSREAAWRVRSLWPTRERAPDDTAIAVFDEVWFSSRPVGTTASDAG